MPDFSKRSQQIEIMDDLNASGEIINVTLGELETINMLLGGNYVTIDGISRLLKNCERDRQISIADLGCGSGDILKLIRRSLKKKGIKSQLTGIDANPNITAYATSHTSPSEEITYEAVNIFSEEFKKRKFDLVVGTLFFHHFTDQQLIDFFRQLRQQVSVGLVINDIHRHWFAFYSIKLLTRFFSRSAMVKHDAPVSVVRAFSKQELVHILREAGLNHYSIRWLWAFRWQVIVDFRK
jgi:2-polyprenyl-3-methyl-5-hydroxy-6-metoxy-1,4-benzoquinol methylase